VASGRHLPHHPILKLRDGNDLLDCLEQGDEEVHVVLIRPGFDHFVFLTPLSLQTALQFSW